MVIFKNPPGYSGPISTTTGAVVSGLNHASSPGVTKLDNDTVGASHTVRYDPCNVSRAGLRWHGYSVMPNTWMDNVAAW
jgi:hypothetical protein